MRREIFLTLSQKIFTWGRKEAHLFFFFFFLIVLHTPITALNQASLNIFFIIPFLHGCHSPSFIFLTALPLLWTIFPSQYLEVAENPHS